MTTEDDFQQLLDYRWEDFHTRLVFADWLQEHNDPRATGYRLIGQRQLSPKHSTVHTGRVFYYRGYFTSGGSILSRPLCNKLRQHSVYKRKIKYIYFATRRQAENTLALVLAANPTLQ